ERGGAGLVGHAEHDQPRRTGRIRSAVCKYAVWAYGAGATGGTEEDSGGDRAADAIPPTAISAAADEWRLAWRPHPGGDPRHRRDARRQTRARRAGGQHR